MPGPERALGLRVAYEDSGFVNITMAMSAPYPNGEVVVWGSSFDGVYKLRREIGQLRLIDSIKSDSFGLRNGLSGAYTLLDRDNVFYAPAQDSVLAYTDAVPGDPNSGIALKASFMLPPEALHFPANKDPIVGINMTYDGYLILATERGTVAAVSRDFQECHYIKLGDPNLGEEVSNSVAIDEDGGIYLVTAAKMYRIQWTGSELSLDPEDGAWTADYEVGPEVGGTLGGAGSGSTPSLMGSGDEDKFVVITDGQLLTHLVLFWRDEIPDDWQPIAEGKDRRIAAELPVDFGDTERVETRSEQSVLVHGYGAVVVSNNDYRRGARYGIPESVVGLYDTLYLSVSTMLGIYPFGVQKFNWNPESRQLEVSWVNRQISCPNGIPTMSVPSNLMYCVGQRYTSWNIEALDWDTGESVFYRRIGFWPIYNSFYAATQVGPNGDIWSGTSTGVMRIGPLR